MHVSQHKPVSEVLKNRLIEAVKPRSSSTSVVGNKLKPEDNHSRLRSQTSNEASSSSRPKGDLSAI